MVCLTGAWTGPTWPDVTGRLRGHVTGVTRVTAEAGDEDAEHGQAVRARALVSAHLQSWVRSSSF